MSQNEKCDSIRLIVALPPRQYFGGNDWQNALTIVESLRPSFPNIFLFDCDAYLSDSDAKFAAQMTAARNFQPNVGLSLPNSSYGLILDKRAAYYKKRFRDYLTFPQHPTPLGNVFADELGVPIIMLWDHLITHAPQFLLGYAPVQRQESLPGSLAKLTDGLVRKNFIHYVPDSGHIEVFDRLGVWEPGSVRRYVVPGHNIFLKDQQEPPNGLIGDRILFVGNLSAGGAISAYGDDPVVQEIRDYVTQVKCKDWGTAAWRAYEAIAAQKVAAGIAELHPDHSFFWALGRPLTTDVVLTAFRTTVFKSLAAPIDFYGGFTDPDFVADLGRSGLFNAMGSVPFEKLGEIYARYQFAVDITHTPFIHGSNAKVLNCFAAGGFMFVDWKEDLHQELGALAEEFMYRSADELNSKIEKLKANPKKRLEIIQAMRLKIANGLNFVAFLSATIRDAAQLARN
ncbi:glycosyltransferase family protein [Methylocapsa acidiphila]|uniref:glycosyltransferase family protein n=1 Tax=Methylocapsa acidiphila TaxID=133552 RepID=UPI0009FF7B8C|nr:glycosyltransferase [Methylocapsa acidiphila]